MVEKIECVKCPSGFWAVLIDGILWDGACVTRKRAEEIAAELVPLFRKNVVVRTENTTAWIF